MPDTMPPERLTDRKRRAVVVAAAEEFRSRGFEGTSMDQIAARAGVSKRTIYNHFSSKEDLFQEIIAILRQRLDAAHFEPYVADRPAGEQLEGIALAMLDVVSHPDLINLGRVVFSRLLASPELAASVLNERDALKDALSDWLHAAARDGRLKLDDLPFATMQFGALLNAFAFWPQILGKRAPLSGAERRRVAESAVGMFLAHYGTPTTAC